MLNKIGGSNMKKTYQQRVEDLQRQIEEMNAKIEALESENATLKGENNAFRITIKVLNEFCNEQQSKPTPKIVCVAG